MGRSVWKRGPKPLRFLNIFIALIITAGGRHVLNSVLIACRSLCAVQVLGAELTSSALKTSVFTC